MANIKINELPSKPEVNNNDLVIVGDETSGDLFKKNANIFLNTYVTPEQYGAVGDGIADDSEAIQLAINSNKTVFLKNKYNIFGTKISLIDNTHLYGNGINSELICNGDNIALEISGKVNIVISDFTLTGSGRGTNVDYETTKPNQIGINMIGGENCILKNLYINNFGGSGIKTTYTDYSSHIGNSFLNISIKDSLVGINCGVRSEYNIFSQIMISENQWGIIIEGGNNIFNSGHISNNKTAIKIIEGENDGHGIISDMTINHNDDYSIFCDGVQYGMMITSCMIYYGNILIKDSVDIKISETFLSISSINIENSTKTIFSNNRYVINPSITDDSNSVFYSDTQVVTTNNEQNISASKFFQTPIFIGPKGSTKFKTLSLGASGGGYGLVGFNVDFTETNNQYKYLNSDNKASIIEFFDGKFLFKTAPVGTAGDNIAFTTVFEIGTDGSIIDAKLKSPNGNLWKLSVDNSGVITTTPI